MISRRLPKSDPRWTTPRQAWVCTTTSANRTVHAVTVVAAPDGSSHNHAITACDTYLSRAALYTEPPDDIDLCDACLMGDTVFHVVYAIHTADGLCQYVGYTADLVARIGQHQRESPWWQPALVVTHTIHDTEADAREAEAALILRLKPIRNRRVNSGGGPRSRSRKATLHVRSDVLLDLLATALDLPAAKLSNPICAQFLGIDQSTFWRLRTDPDYVASSSFVAQVLAIFGGIPDDLFEARFTHLAIAA